MYKSKREEYLKRRIFSALDDIEDYTGLMAHEIPEIRDNLRSWQDGNLRDLYFERRLMRFLDSLNVPERLLDQG